MARRATEPGTGQNEVFELNNDARWQARLDEARARRAEALKKQGRVDRPQRTPRKPWEDEAETSVEAEQHQRPLDDTGLDFHDRMNALQKVLKDARPKPTPSPSAPPRPAPGANWSPEGAHEALVEPVLRAPNATPKVGAAPAEPPKPAGPSVDSLFADPAFAPPVVAPVGVALEKPEFVPISDLLLPAPAPRTNAEARPWLIAAEEEDTIVAARGELNEAVLREEEAPEAPKKGMPFLLGVGLVALIALPFVNLLPPMQRGPAEAPAPAFGLQPALGITAAMAEFPAPTQSGEFVPTSSTAPRGPLTLVDPSPPVFSRTMPALAAAPTPEVFEMPVIGATVDPVILPFARTSVPDVSVTQAVQEAQLGVLFGAGPLPDVLASVAASGLIPAPRP